MPGIDGEDYDYSTHGVNPSTEENLRELGLELMWNDCPGFLNEACLAWAVA
jgi:hypothetical protein